MMISGSRTRAWTAHACAGATDSLRNAYGRHAHDPGLRGPFSVPRAPAPFRYNVYSFRNVIPRYFACSARFRLFVLQAGKTSSAIARGRIVVEASIPVRPPLRLRPRATATPPGGEISLARRHGFRTRFRTWFDRTDRSARHPHRAVIFESRIAVMRIRDVQAIPSGNGPAIAYLIVAKANISDWEKPENYFAKLISFTYVR